MSDVSIEKFPHLSPCRPPNLDAPMPPPVRFVRKGDKPRNYFAPYTTGKADEREIQFNTVEFEKFIALWEKYDFNPQHTA